MFAFAILILTSPFSWAGGSSVHHYMATRMSCHLTQRLVSAEGAVILHYGNDRFTRVVANVTHCEREQNAKPRLLPTADFSECFVGLECDDSDKGAEGP